MKAKTIQTAFNILISPALKMRNEFNVHTKVKNLKALKALNDEIQEALREKELDHAMLDDKQAPVMDAESRLRFTVAGQKLANKAKRDWLANTDLPFIPIAFRNNPEMKDLAANFIINDLEFFLPAELLEEPKEEPLESANLKTVTE